MGKLRSFFNSFGKKKSAIASAATSISLSQAYSIAKGGAFGGWALARFQSIVDAHASVEDIIEEFGLDEEGCGYQSVDGYDDPWTQAHEELLEVAEQEAEMMGALGIDVDPEELINQEELEELAYSYAYDLANAWYSGAEWVPEEVMDWAWYDLSGHNG